MDFGFAPRAALPSGQFDGVRFPLDSAKIATAVWGIVFAVGDSEKHENWE